MVKISNEYNKRVPTGTRLFMVSSFELCVFKHGITHNIVLSIYNFDIILSRDIHRNLEGFGMLYQG